MTPYALLLVRPTDDDATVRRAFHALAKECHPDRVPEAAAVWAAAKEAYEVVKTAADRARWGERQALLVGAVCALCSGCGVTGTRSFGGNVKVCPVCKGEGKTSPT